MNSTHTVSDLLCKDKYKYADINWKGHVIRIDYNDNFFARYRLSLLIKMEQTETEDPDLYLKFTDYNYDMYKNKIFNITRGDFVNFNATFMHLGDDGAVPLLESFGFDKLEGHIYIQPHVHHNGRYSVPHDSVIHKDQAVYKELPGIVSDDELNVDQKETFH